MPSDIVDTIQSILAPALGISATALLLLGLTNRYASMINRIRQLSSEKRTIISELIKQNVLEYNQNVRLASIVSQIKNLMYRAGKIRNAILLFQSSIILFVLTSVTIGIHFFVKSKFMEILPLLFFMLGMIFVLIGICFAAWEIYNSFKVADLEVKAE
jgi:hypothetical protein